MDRTTLIPAWASQPSASMHKGALPGCSSHGYVLHFDIKPELSFYDPPGILGQDYAPGLVPPALGYDPGIGDLAGLCPDSIALQGVSRLVSLSHSNSRRPSLFSSSTILQTSL